MDCALPAATVPRLRERLSDQAAATGSIRPDLRQAAVAAVFDGTARERLLLIQRAEHDDDPWSGHMALPGGRVDPGDDHALAAAVREAREELGLELDPAEELLGELSPVRAVGRGRVLKLLIRPFVFELDRPVTLTPNHEVDHAIWIPFDFFRDPANRSRLLWHRDGVPIPLPCYRWEGRTIWGLTLKIIDEIRELVSV